MKIHQGSSEGSKLGVTASYFEILRIINESTPRSGGSYSGPYCIHDIAPTTLMTFAGIGNDYLKVIILAKYLLNAAVVATLLPRLIMLRDILVTQLLRRGHKLWCLIVRRLVIGGRSDGSLKT